MFEGKMGKKIKKQGGEKWKSVYNHFPFSQTDRGW